MAFRCAPQLQAGQPYVGTAHLVERTCGRYRVRGQHNGPRVEAAAGGSNDRARRSGGRKSELHVTCAQLVGTRGRGRTPGEGQHGTTRRRVRYQNAPPVEQVPEARAPPRRNHVSASLHWCEAEASPRKGRLRIIRSQASTLLAGGKYHIPERGREVIGGGSYSSVDFSAGHQLRRRSQ